MTSVAPHFFGLLLLTALVATIAEAQDPVTSRPSVEAGGGVETKPLSPDWLLYDSTTTFSPWPEESRIDLGALFVEAAPKWPPLPETPRPPARRRSSRKSGLAPVETWLNSNLSSLGKDLSNFRFETTTIRSYGRRDFSGKASEGSADAEQASHPIEEIRRELVIRATPEGLKATEAKVRTLKAEIGRRYKIRARMIATNAAGAATSLETKQVPLRDVEALLTRPAAADFLVLADGVVDTVAMRPAEYGNVVERLFVVDNQVGSVVDADGRQRASVVKPIYEGVPEGCRISVTPLVYRPQDGTTEFTASFEIAQILAPVGTSESTLANGLKAKFEIPETNETTWRSPVITCNARTQAVVVDGIRWARVSPEDGMFDLTLVMTIELLEPPMTIGRAVGKADPVIVALGADGAAVAEVPEGAVAPTLGARLVLRRSDIEAGVMQVTRIEGALLRLTLVEGAPARLGDRLVKP